MSSRSKGVQTSIADDPLCQCLKLTLARRLATTRVRSSVGRQVLDDFSLLNVDATTLLQSGTTPRSSTTRTVVMSEIRPGIANVSESTSGNSAGLVSTMFGLGMFRVVGMGLFRNSFNLRRRTFQMEGMEKICCRHGGNRNHGHWSRAGELVVGVHIQHAFGIHVVIPFRPESNANEATPDLDITSTG